jgi:hypothetical protein
MYSLIEVNSSEKSSVEYMCHFAWTNKSLNTQNWSCFVYLGLRFKYCQTWKLDIHKQNSCKLHGICEGNTYNMFDLKWKFTL